MVTKGEIPIAKNVVVTDEYGKQIGSTYLKRAKGLVKNGRAEYVNDCTIRLTHAPSVIHDNTEELIMSNVIDFNTRDFYFDSDIENPAGTRKFVTDNAGNNVEVFELGDWKWAWDQIRCTKSLLPDTDYVFRFAMTGGFHDSENVVSQFIIFFDDQWDDRYVYSLTRSEYKPAISKRYGDNLLRIYEIPFHTGRKQETTFMFRSQHTVACFMPAQDTEYYADMEDLDYEAWWKERQSLIGHGRQRSEGQFDGMDEWDSNEEEGDSENIRNIDIDLSGASLSQVDLMRVLTAATTGNCRINLSGADITEFR